MNGQSQTPQEIKLAQLKELFPEVFNEQKVDWEKLKATLGEDIDFANEHYVLNWAGKSDAFKVLQTPTSKTLNPCKEESVDFENTNNIFIEGENLEALKVLQKSYFGKIKMIYIDPPYNTGNDSFVYPDKFSESKASYQTRVGDKDADGNATCDNKFKKNSKENGQYHSNWLNMMYPRLFLAKNLLKQDGVIFVSIDDNEVHNLRLIMNEVFGEENFEVHIHWRRRHNQPNGKTKMIGLVAEHAITENMLVKLMLKSGKDLNSKIRLADGYICINSNQPAPEIIFMLEKTNQTIVDNVIAEKPQKVIALDRLFKNNDQLKTNTLLQMQDAGIEFKTI